MGAFGNESNYASPINLSYHKKWWVLICCNMGKGVSLLKEIVRVIELGKGLRSYNVKHTPCPSTHYNWHLCRVICESHQGFKRYRADTKVSLTLKYHLDLEVTLEKIALCTSSHGTLHWCSHFKMSPTLQDV